MKRGLNHKNSLPDPEFGGESSESARAIHYVVQKDTLMTYVSALIAQADLRKLRGSTIERKQMSTKTIYKRIALVAVASLGFGVLTSVSPASATAPTAVELTFTPTGSTTAVAGDVAAAETIYVRSTSTSNKFVYTLPASLTTANAETVELTLSTADARANITEANSVVITAVSEDNGSTTTSIADAIDANSTDDNTIAKLLFSADISAETTVTFSTGALAAGTYYLWHDSDATDVATGDGVLAATVTSYTVGAPVTASYSAVGYTQIGTRASQNATLSLKDSSSRSTFLVGDEQLSHVSTPVTNATAPAVQGIDNIDTDGLTKADTTPTATAGVFAGYTVAINAAAGTQPTKNTLFTIASTITKGATAFGSTSVTYRNVDTTASIAGGSITFTGATSKAVVSTISTVTSLQTTAADYVITVKDAAGALVKGATPVATATSGTVSAAVAETIGAGTDSTFQFTPSATAGTSTVTFTLATGATSMSTSVAITATGYGSTVATTASVTSVVKSDGSGVVRTSTLPATNTWSAARNVSGLVVTVGGLDASKVAKFTVGGNATGPKINATTGSIYPVASAAGVVTFNLSITSATNGQNITVGIDANGAGGDEVTLTISFDDTAATLTTAPVSGTLNMSTPSQTKPVAATLADQFGNAITGGSFTLTNTVVPAGATAATAVTANADAAGKATLNAVLGATLGTYTFELKAFSANATQAGSTSTISWSVTTTGIAGSLTLTDNDNVTTTATTTDDKGSRTVVVPLSAAGVTVSVAVGAATTDSATAIIVTSATPSGLAFTATATNGIRLFTTTPNGAALAAGKSEVTGTAGSSINLWAVPTKVGAGTITVVSGGLTKVYTLTGTAAAAATVKSAIITLTPTANAGQYTVKASDALGNGVVNDVAISLAGPGAFSNGFKNLTVTTGADGTNTFNVVSDGSAATTITAKLSASGNGAYVAITAAEATASGLVLLGTLGASTDTATASLAGKGGNADSTTLATLTTLVNSLIAKINALNKLVIKIQKKVRA